MRESWRVAWLTPLAKTVVDAAITEDDTAAVDPAAGTKEAVDNQSRPTRTAGRRQTTKLPKVSAVPNDSATSCKQAKDGILRRTDDEDQRSAAGQVTPTTTETTAVRSVT